MIHYTRLLPYSYFKRVPMLDRIGVYSFALKPEEHQPSGTCNFSRIDSAQLVFNKLPSFKWRDGATLTPLNNIRVYAINYNVLRIMSGMGPGYFTSMTTNNLYGNDGNLGKVELLVEGVTL